MRTNSGITYEALESFETAFDADRANKIAMNAVINNGIHNAARNSTALQDNPYVFSVNLKQGEITNQKESGRCWMFAALNVMRFKAMHDLNLKTFELSQAYPLFFDKLEKSNYFLNSILETLDEPVNGRLISYLRQAPLNDGGQWDMFCNLVKKYGVVPISAYPERNLSSATRELNSYLTEKLREDACILRKRHTAGEDIETLHALRMKMMEEIYRFLCLCLGRPPKTFDFEYCDKEDGFHRDRGLTPHTFFEKYINMNLDDYVSLINAPTADKPYGRSYTVKFLGNVKEGNIVRYLNLEIGELKKAAIAQMQDGSPVWFGCDVGKRSDRESGVMDLDMFKIEELLNTTFTMNKAERLDYGQSLMTHAMVFQGVNLDENGVPNRWRVENSWGKDAGTEGYYVMTDRWFDEYIYQVVVNKKYLSDAQIHSYESEPIELEPWDPMGSLAYYTERQI